MGNYLRVRGEYESPAAFAIPVGTTSACAENTRVDAVKIRNFGNYLRVRGEYSNCATIFNPLAELPPRARRIHFLVVDPCAGDGTTSACAENTRG